jgi:hypothetical protein
MQKPPFWPSIKKLSRLAMAILSLTLLSSAGFFFIKKEINKSRIPDGIYKLTEPRPFNAAEYNLSGSYFGSVLIIDGTNAVTNLSPNISYPIKNNGEQNYKIGPALAYCKYQNEQLIFNCDDTFIIYQLQKHNH